MCDTGPVGHGGWPAGARRDRDQCWTSAPDMGPKRALTTLACTGRRREPVLNSARQRPARFERDALPHLDRVYCAALCLTEGQAAANELAQETFATACAAFGRLEPGANVIAWLYCILVSTFASGTGGRQRSGDGLASRDRPTAAEIQAVERLPGADVSRALHELPPDLRIVVYLADAEGFTCQEIAGITGVPTGPVISRLRRGRRQLGELLRDYAATRGQDAEQCKTRCAHGQPAGDEEPVLPWAAEVYSRPKPYSAECSGPR